MLKIAWSTFLKRHPTGYLHLVVAGIPIDTDRDLGIRHLRTLHGRLSKLVTRLAGTVGARADVVPSSTISPGASPGWASRRSFVLDEATGAAIAAGMLTDGELNERELGTNANQTRQ